MLRLGRLTDYSTVILFHMAGQPWRVYSAAGVAAAVGLPGATVAKILKTLAREHLVHSMRGAKGGYVLARPPAQISVAAVIDAMEGPFGVTECSAHPGRCGQEAGCPSRENWQRLNLIVRRVLDGVSLADMCAPTPAALPGARRRAAA
ncbi:MAG: SUF system Fe-S cluster assembly regulator [Rhodocyclales bacterium]|nr:SUF system Fe-S cluster assembly regulator [Rhodocyclales bacterium]